jgi:predicted TIM-barrel fold metal-dependent hydrolase
MQIESAGFLSQRAVWWMIWAGVFERHPDLKLVITETPGNWFPTTAIELDALHAFYDSKRDEPLNKALLDQVPRRPSEYMANNVFVGASFASPYEVHAALEHGMGSQLLWGSDYPHLEGTFVYPEGRDLPSVTRLALRNTFCDVPVDDARRMIGENAIAVYNLDRDALQQIAQAIDAPTVAELATPIDAVPEGASITAFRAGAGGWS